MNITFYEVQDWERDTLARTFPQATLVAEPLNDTNIDKAHDAQLVSGFIKTHMTQKELDHLPNLQYMITRSTGYDHIDVTACQARGVTVCNVPSYGTHTVAEHTFALILTLTRCMYNSINHAKECNFDHEQIRGVDLFGKTLGIVGFGKIGRAVYEIARGFGMKVIIFARHADEDLAQKDPSVTFTTDLKMLCQTSDIVSMHLLYSKDTHHILNHEMIGYMKKGSYIVNTARGGLIDTEALLWGIDENILDGVGLDVFEQEEMLSEEVNILSRDYRETSNIRTILLDHILMRHPKVIVTPHNGFNSKEALENILATTIENIRACESASAINTVTT